MATSLLDKVRKINQLLQKSVEVEMDFSPMVATLGRVIAANVYLIGQDGLVLGHYVEGSPDCEAVDLDEEISLSPQFQQRLAFLPQPAVNVKVDNCFFHDETCDCPSRLMTVIPIETSGERLGHLILTRGQTAFDDDDLVLAEVSATIIGMTVLRHRLARTESDARQKANVQIALDSLSYSEMEAITNVFQELNGTEGFLVASKVADRIGITRSVIVNAMRKLESAGVVESRSLGMKGTFIRVQNRFLLDELNKRSHSAK